MAKLRELVSTTAFAAALALGGCGGSDDPSNDGLVSVSYGDLQGVDDSATTGTLAWKGIPYAKPPVGELRWRAPVAPEPWKGVRDATKFGQACLQNGRIYGPGANNTYDGTIATTLNKPVGSEDCLTLNVWRPAGGESSLPVIFFVYGGSNISGYSADPVYDGAMLAKKANAVVVSANYRVGPLGFFNLPQLKTGDPAEDSGNFALLDLIQALKFVQDNASEFGGDAGNVTLMGQSAGAINVYALMTAPSAAGLFHKAVPLSGGISLASNLAAGRLPTLSPPSTYEAQGIGLLVKQLIADGLADDAAGAQAWISAHSKAEVAAYLRGKDGAVLLGTLLAGGLTGSGPIPDGKFLPSDLIAAIAAGNYHQVPVMAGMTSEEGKLFAPFLTLFGGPPGFKIDDATRFNMMAGFNPDAPTTLTEADVINPAYLPATTPASGWNDKSGLLGTLFMAASRDNVLNTLVSRQSNVWYYQFNWAQEPAPWNVVYGAAHAFDLPFLFGNFGPSLFSNAVGGTANQEGRLALSDAMMSSLAAFAQNGDPNNAKLGVQWKPWPAQLVFDATLTKANITTR